VAGASDFPHSRQDGLERDVINPQNGHILCEAKPRTGGVSDANSFETDVVMETSRRRKRSRNRRRKRSINHSPPSRRWHIAARYAVQDCSHSGRRRAHELWRRSQVWGLKSHPEHLGAGDTENWEL